MERSRNSLHFTSLALIALLPLVIPGPECGAHQSYDGCRTCHGNFRAASYISLVDGQDWGNLHNLHRSTMLNSDCATCHVGSYNTPFIGESDGGIGFPAISCMGCHGRAEDMGHDSISPGRGAGLRQHHTNAGVMECVTCHDDADPANYTPVGENVEPPYYFLPDAAHPNKPTNPCNVDGAEDYAGSPEGLDNDGDQAYDGADSDCGPACPADLDGSGDVGFNDLLAVLSNWGACAGCPEDLDGDDQVGFSDLLTVLAAWGPC